MAISTKKVQKRGKKTVAATQKARAKVVSNRKSGGVSGWLQSRGMAVLAVVAFGLLGVDGLAWVHAATTTSTLWSKSTVPKTISWSDNQSVEVGVKFKSKYAGEVLGIRFYKGPQNTGTHVGSLWTADGQPLAKITFSNETASGWQTAKFAQPVAISANTTYVAAYYLPKGYYPVNIGYFSQAHTSADGVLTAPVNAGVYKRSSGTVFPDQTYQADNYWVDALVQTSRFVPTTKPAAPGNMQASVYNGTVKVTWDASPATGIAKYTVYRDGAPLTTVDPTTLSYVDTTVTAGTSYSYQVAAVLTDGTTSDLSSSVSATVPTTAPDPTPVTTPNPTPSPTPSPQPGPVSTGSSSCTPSSSATFASCGFPTASTTGVPAGTTLKSQSGTLTVTADNTVINGLHLSGVLDIEASNVTVENSEITANSWSGIQVGASNKNATGLRILHTKVDSDPGQGPDNGGSDYAIRQMNSNPMEVAYSDISGYKDGIDIINANVHDNYIHDIAYFTGAHTQALYVWSGPGATITHNTLLDQDKNGGTAAIYVAPDSPNHKNVTVSDNWLAGGAYTVYGSDSSGTNIQFLNNYFSTEVYATGGQFGPVGYWYNNSGNVFSGNVWANGSKAGQTVGS